MMMEVMEVGSPMMPLTSPAPTRFLFHFHCRFEPNHSQHRSIYRISKAFLPKEWRDERLRQSFNSPKTTRLPFWQAAEETALAMSSSSNRKTSLLAKHSLMNLFPQMNSTECSTAFRKRLGKTPPYGFRLPERKAKRGSPMILDRPSKKDGCGRADWQQQRIFSRPVTCTICPRSNISACTPLRPADSMWRTLTFWTAEHPCLLSSDSIDRCAWKEGSFASSGFIKKISHRHSV